MRLAQRWTPLTGILSEGEEVPAETSSVPKAKKPSGESGADKTAAEPAKPAGAASAVPSATQSLNVVLSRMVTDGQPHGSLGVRTMAVDADLADALSLPERGVLVTEGSAAQGGLRADTGQLLM